MIDVEVEDPAWIRALPDAAAVAQRAAEAVLAAQGREGDGVAILLADDAAVADLNLRFRRRQGPTNVLSFPAARNPERHLGDIALASGVCLGEAQAQGKAIAHHLQHLVAHGVLHLLGYDHLTDRDAEVMESLERVILNGLGAPDPYEVG